MENITKKKAIQVLVESAVKNYATGFRCRHESEVDNPDGVINMKVHNVFIEALGTDIQYYASLVRSLDSSLGNMIEDITHHVSYASKKLLIEPKTSSRW